MLRELRLLTQRFGLDVQRADIFTIESKRFARLLDTLEIEIILDVGANIGQFANEVFNEGYSGGIVSFEPLPDAHGILEVESKRRNNWKIAPRMALGGANEKRNLYVSKNSVSSSLLRIENSHIVAAPNSSTITTIEVDVRRLDDVVGELEIPLEKSFLKLDTQGTEKAVLHGLGHHIAKIIGIKLEFSITKLYDGQSDFLDLLLYLRDQGFELWDISPGFRDPKTAKIHQFDGTLVRKERIS